MHHHSFHFCLLNPDLEKANQNFAYSFKKCFLLPVGIRCHQRSNIVPKSYVVEPKELADDVWYDKILTLKQIRASQTAATRLEEEESK